MLSHRATRVFALACGRLFVLLIIAGLLFTPAYVTAQEEEMPRDFRKDLARQKADRFAGLYMADQAQTANQDDYDVVYYELDLDLDPVTSIVSGSVTVTGEITGASLSTIELNLLSNMLVNAVTWSGGSLAYSHISDILTVTLDRTYIQGEMFEFTVVYSGTPNTQWGAFGFDTYSTEPMIWSLSEPYGARTWWPCKDVPSDKADSVDIHITVPSDLIVASNGNLVSETINGPDKTYHWHEGYPITTYLVSVAIHPYTTYSDWYVYSPTDSMEIQFYVFPRQIHARRGQLCEKPLR